MAATPAEVARKILLYSYLMVAVTLALAPYAGWLYTVCAAGLGGWFLLEAHRLRARVAAMPWADQPVGALRAAGLSVPPPEPVAAGPAGAATATVVDMATTVDTAAATDEAASPGVAEGACAGLIQPSANPAPMRLFHLSIAYLTLLFAVIAVTAVLPWGTW